MTKNLAVLGAGYWGKNLIRNFNQLGVLNTICDNQEDISKAYKQQYPEAIFTTSFQDVLDNPTIEAVAIATPAVTHFDLALAALKAGKHVFVEKPLALTVEEGERLVKLADSMQRVLMVGHILQYHSAVIKLKELIDAGELGKVNYLSSNRLSIGKIRNEENILWSFAPHDISVILMLLNEEPTNVQATGGCYLQQQVADVTLTTMDFPSGAKAHIFVSWLHPFKEQKLIVIGDRKMAVFDDVGEEKLLLYPHQINWVHRMPVASKAEAESVKIKMEEPLRQECLHFNLCIRNGNTAKTDGREGIRVLRVLQASQASLDRYLKAGFTEDQLSWFDVNKKPIKDYFCHESAYIDDNVSVGTGTKIWHFSHLMPGTSIGERCNIGQNVVIGPDVNIGNGCKIQNNVSVYKGVTLEENVFCGPSVVFTNIYNPRAHIPRMTEVRPTIVKRGATLGANCTIVCGHTIGTYAFIGAGAVVIGDVSDHALMVGNPACRIGWMCACGQKIDMSGETGTCDNCGTVYRQVSDCLKKINQ